MIVEGKLLGVRGFTERLGLWIDGGRIREVAPLTELRARFPAARVHRVEWITPGLADAHVHPLQFGARMRELDLSGLQAPSPVLECVRAFLTDRPGARWVVGGGFLFREKPVRRWLDDLGGDRFIVLRSRDLHAAWVNENALRAAGFSPSSPWVDWEAGWVVERGLEALRKVMPKPSKEDLLVGFLEFARRGYTAVHTMAAEPFETLSWALGLELPVRVWWAVPRGAWREVEPGWKNSRLFLGGVKFFADGALGSRTAWMTAAYPDGSYGMAVDSVEEILEEGRSALQAGYTLAVHAIGSRAVAGVVRAFRALRSHARRPLRLEHAQHLDDETLAGMRGLPLAVSMQPVHLAGDADLIASFFPDRRHEAYRFKSLSRVAPLAFGSDAPVAPPDWGQTLAEATHHRLSPTESLTFEDALFAMTRGPALAAGWRKYGLIAPGALADLGLWEGGRLVARVFDGVLEDVGAA